MPARSANRVVLVTGASGHIGSRVCSLLRASGCDVLAVDLRPNVGERTEPCDITRTDQIAGLFASHPIGTVVHLAAVLPTAFRADPIAAATINISGTFTLLQASVARGVNRFVFGSSMSVYGSSQSTRHLTEGDPPAPDDPYGAAKHLVELVGENLGSARALDFVSLRIARVVGPGARRTSSPWRSQIFEPADSHDHMSISIPFAPSARLGLVHVDEVARMLTLMTLATELPHRIYNGPAEVWETQRLAEIIGGANVDVRMGQEHGGPIGSGALFTQDFAFQLKGLGHYLSSRRGLTRA